MSPFNSEWQTYPGGDSTDNARVKDGKSAADGKTFKYGKIAARIQLAYGKGIWPAFWMLGDNISETGGDTPWPASGEIDILGTVSGTIHYKNASGGHSYAPPRKMTLPDEQIFAENFHVFEIEWDADGRIPCYYRFGIFGVSPAFLCNFQHRRWRPFHP